MTKRRLAVIIAFCLVAVVVLIVVLEKEEPEYTVSVDVSDASCIPKLEYWLAKGEALHGKLVVHKGNVVFLVTDYWDNRLHDVVVRAGESYAFSRRARQTGELYICYFLYLHGEKDLPRNARFYCNMTGKVGDMRA